MFRSIETAVRTTIDIPEREHALFTSLARSQRVSLSKLLLDLAAKGETFYGRFPPKKQAAA